MFVKRPVNLVRSPIPVPQDDIPLAAPPAVIREGYSAIAATLLQLASGKGSGKLYVALDGTHGAPFQAVLQKLWRRLSKRVIPCPSSVRAAISSQAKSCGNFCRQYYG
ncbi:hypothetical protein ACFTAO_13945 [Paenibacillus rhizoplanae]